MTSSTDLIGESPCIPALDAHDEYGWLTAAFSDAELSAVFAPTSAAVHEGGDDVLVVGADGSLAWHGDPLHLERWQCDVLHACTWANPFEAWTLDHTLDAFRGTLDVSERPARRVGAMPPPQRRAVRRAARGSERRALDAAIADDALEEWLAAGVGRLGRVSRILHELWLGRPDLHGLYPRVGDRDDSSSAFLGWVREHGAVEHGLPDLFVPSEQVASMRIVSEAPARRGVRIAGYVDATLGMGEAARRVERALGRAGVHARRMTVPDAGDLDVNLLCLNATEVTEFASDLGPAYFADRHTIAVWFWESTSPPPSLEAALEYVDEIWVASDYVRSVLEPHITDGTPIHVMPLAVRAPQPGPHTRAELGLPEDAYLYGFLFDFNSTLERKHACGLVDAYTRAYPTASADTALVIKTIHAELNVADHERLLLATRDRPDIHVIDAHLPIDQRDSLIAHLDCYVSLHRSEGFGLTIAEALLCGVPTIATGYSANVEFAPADCCYLVDYQMTTVPEGIGPYPAGGEWADPDLDHAARLMLHVRAHPDQARAMAARGAQRIARTCSLDAAGAFMRTRLEQIWKDNPLPEPAPPDDEPAPDPIGDVERYVNSGPAAGWDAGATGLKRLLRRTILRLVRPYSDRQKELEVDVARSLRHLQQQVDELATRRD